MGLFYQVLALGLLDLLQATALAKGEVLRFNELLKRFHMFGLVLTCGFRELLLVLLVFSVTIVLIHLELGNRLGSVVKRIQESNGGSSIQSVHLLG